MKDIKVKSFQITRYVCVNEGLCPAVFQDENKIFTPVQEGLERIADFWLRQTRKIFPEIKPKDIIIYGDLMGYVYNSLSEVSIGILSELPQECLPHIDDINETLVANEFAYKFLLRPIHCRLLPQLFTGIPSYSLSQKKWIIQPQRREFSFTTEELCQAFPEYQIGVHFFIDSLPKHENGLLTMESCKIVEKYLQDLEAEAMDLWKNSSEHEYNLGYLLWRTFKEVGGVRHFNLLLSKSYNYNINELEQC